jgi:hypothetical protein
VDLDEIMCSYDFAWHPDVKDGKIHALHCVLNYVVLHVRVCLRERERESVCVGVGVIVCMCVRF